jgi:hypothetical protein
MRIKLTALAFALAGCVGLVGMASAAETCTAGQGAIVATPATPFTSPAGASTCGNNPTFGDICSGGTESFNGAGEDIYSVAIGASENFTISVTSGAFFPNIFLIGTSCNDTVNCSVNATNGTGTISSGAVTTAPVGTNFLVVADTGVDTPGCGAYTLTVTGTLPVELQKFSVE